MSEQVRRMDLPGRRVKIRFDVHVNEEDSKTDMLTVVFFFFFLLGSLELMVEGIGEEEGRGKKRRGGGIFGTTNL